MVTGTKELKEDINKDPHWIKHTRHSLNFLVNQDRENGLLRPRSLGQKTRRSTSWIDQLLGTFLAIYKHFFGLFLYFVVFKLISNSCWTP